MKKALTILAIAAMAASVAMADVVSDNVVGFSQKGVISNTYWMIACNFQGVNGTNEISIQDIIPSSEVYHDPGDNPAKCDSIMVYNGATYKTYVYNRLFDPEEEVYYGDPIWKDGLVAATNKFRRGQSFWYKRSPTSTATTLTAVGQVPMDASFEHVSLPIGYFMIGNAYPNSTAISNLSMTAYHDAGNNPAKCDQIMVYNGATYKTYVFNKLFDPEEEVYYGSPVWKDGLVPASTGFLIGQGAWYKRSADASGSATWTETKPY